MATQGAWIRSWNFTVYILLIVPMIVYRCWPKILMVSTPLVILFKYTTFIYFQHYMMNDVETKSQITTFSVIFNLFFILTIYIFYLFFGATDYLVTAIIGVSQTVTALYIMVRFVCVPVISELSTTKDYLMPFTTTIVITILSLAASHYTVYRNEIELFLFNEENIR